MNITEITVSYEATQSLSDYSNVRPGVRLTATLGENDDYVIARQNLLAEARAVVHEEIDRCLIGDGKAPRYYIGPRFQAMHNRDLHVIVIMPNEASPNLLPGFGWYHHGVRRMSLDQARRLMTEYVAQTGFTAVDCSNGDLSIMTQFVNLPVQDHADESDDKEQPF